MNGPEIYYFSGTGNSFAVARDIAQKTSGKLISIATVMDIGVIRPNSDVIGIVFPVYFAWFGGIPLVLERFAKKLEGIEGKYIFAVCTYGNGTGPALAELSKLIEIRGGEVNAGFAVQMPYNYVMGSKLRTINTEKQQELFNIWKKKLEIICECVNTNKTCELETNVSSAKGLIGLLLRMIKTSTKLKQLYKSYLQKQAGFSKICDVPFTQILPLMAKNFHADEKCDGCGTCKKVCSVYNIGMSNNKPYWGHQCEQCFACLHWCPKGAIQFGTETEGKRYHHPDVMLSDLINK